MDYTTDRVTQYDRRRDEEMLARLRARQLTITKELAQTDRDHETKPDTPWKPEDCL